jgi:phospholipase C
MTAGLDNLKHIVVLMMSSRSFDHMLGGLSLVQEDGKKKYPKINGLTGSEWNPDAAGATVTVKPNAEFQGQLDIDPDHHFPGVDLQLFGGAPPGPGRTANMQGFVKSYSTQTNDVNRSHNIMNYFTPDKLPVLSTIATQFAVFNGWFSSIPGPTICNRAFAHYGTSFGQVGMDIFYAKDPILSIYERMIQAGHTAKIYYYDEQSSTMDTVNLLKSRPQISGTYSQFIGDCMAGHLPEYSFVEPSFNDHTGPGGGQVLASDQHPDHNVQEGERFIANTYNAIRTNPELWKSTALLITYDQHGGIYDHVAPPACTSDGYSANSADTGTGEPFNFDRLGVRVPAVLVSPYIFRGTVVPGPEDTANGRVFEHACIPATITNFFLKNYDKRTVREKQANTFLDLLSDQMRPDSDIPYFKLGGSSSKLSPLDQGRVDLLRRIEESLPQDRRTGTDIDRIQTGDQVNDYVSKMIAIIRSASEYRAQSVGTGSNAYASFEERAPLPQPTGGRSGESQFKSTIAGFRSDTTSGDDLLGINRDVEALCSVLAAKDVDPPISIGLFGDWGSGKTFFMKQMEREFDRIIEESRKTKNQTAYCSNIVQLWFNAWHYTDANLWASLVSHIFEGLALRLSPQKDDQESRAGLLKELETAKELKAEAESDRKQAVLQKEETEATLKKLAEDRAKVEVRLADLRLPDLQLLLQSDPALKSELDKTLKALGFPAVTESLINLQTTLREAYSLSGRFRATTLLLWRSKSRVTLVVLIVVIIVGFPVLTLALKQWLPNQWYFARTATVCAELTALIGSLAASLNKYARQGSEFLNRLEDARRKVTTLVERKKQSQSNEELSLEKQLNEIKAKEVGASKQFSDAETKVREIEQKIREIDEGRSLSKFLLERVRTEDYRKYLGIISSIRKDFETLDSLLPRGARAGSGALTQPIDRIVLYIDDLDRCPEDRVVEVLQAIHLLLYFRIFVVIVGVDSRWLLHSLRQHSRAFQDVSPGGTYLSEVERTHWQSTPLNYLEKIFQIPFALEPMPLEGFQRLMDSLTEQQASSGRAIVQQLPLVSDGELLPGEISGPRIVQSAQDSMAAPPESARPSMVSVPSTDAVSPKLVAAPLSLLQRSFDPNPKHLQLEQAEREFMHRLYSLIPSPRAAKRFVNVYRLLRTLVSDSELAAFVGTGQIGDYQVLQLLLAIQTGYPEQAIQFIRDLPDQNPQMLWWDFARQYRDRARFATEAAQRSNDPPRATMDEGGVALLLESDRWRLFLERLESLEGQILAGQSCESFIKWAPRVARYSFRSAPGQQSKLKRPGS